MKKWVVYFTGGVICVAAVLFSLYYPFGVSEAGAVTGSVVSSFQLPLGERTGRNPQGLTYDGQYLWLMDADFKHNTPQIYKISTSGVIISSFPPPDLGGDSYNGNTKGLAFGGTNLRLAASGSSGGTFAGRIYKISTSGSNLGYITIGNTLPFGVGWGGGSLWEVDNKSGWVYEINSTSGSTVSSFNASGEIGTGRKAAGLAYETGAGRIWLSGFGQNDSIYGYTAAGSFVGSFNTPSTHPMGLAWDGTYLWYVDGCTDYFYKIQ